MIVGLQKWRYNMLQYYCTIEHTGNIQQPDIDEDSSPQIQPPLKMFTADMGETFGPSKPLSRQPLSQKVEYSTILFIIIKHFCLLFSCLLILLLLFCSSIFSKVLLHLSLLRLVYISIKIWL
ncbi:hypothetical protein C0J52_25766 [Blattella germanica]|nr:hypothetical protein C0J52_25766 [Blattella germanica]